MFFRQVLKLPNLQLILFAPRGLITILLFLSIPTVSGIPLINEEVITLVILLSMALMMAGNFFSVKDIDQSDRNENKFSL
jgi:potassium/hydrogen antiporter